MRRAPNPACDDRTLVANIAAMDRIVDELRKEGQAPFDPGNRSLLGLPPVPPHLVETLHARDLFSSARLAYARLVNANARATLQTILQELELPKALRSRMEGWNRYFGRTSSPGRTRKDYAQPRAFYDAQLARYTKMMADIHESRRVGVAHGVCAMVDPARSVMAGPFTLVNTGGFSPETMARVKHVVEKAVALIEAKGLAVILYGDIYVTNTISRSRVLAFYEPDTDEMFVRANVRDDVDTTRTVIHELGHRLDFMFMRTRSANAALHNLYGKVRDAHRHHVRQREREADAAVKLGDTITVKGVTYHVVLIEPRTVRLKVAGAPPEKAWTHKIPKESYAQIKAGMQEKPEGFGAFVSKYASKNPIENFAEMFSFWALGRLSAQDTTWLVETIPTALFQNDPSATKEAQTLLDGLGSQKDALEHARSEIKAWKKSLVDARKTKRTGTGSDEVEFATSMVRFWAAVAAILR